MAELFASGRVVEVILLAMLLESAVIMYVRKKSHRGVGNATLATNLAAGAALMLSLRAALIGASWQDVSMWLVVSLLAHIADLKMRWNAL